MSVRVSGQWIPNDRNDHCYPSIHQHDCASRQSKGSRPESSSISMACRSNPLVTSHVLVTVNTCVAIAKCCTCAWASATQPAPGDHWMHRCTQCPSVPQSAMNMTMTIQTNHRPSIKRTQLQLAATATVKSVRRILFSLCFVTVLSPSLPVFEPAALFFTAN